MRIYYLLLYAILLVVTYSISSANSLSIIFRTDDLEFEESWNCYCNGLRLSHDLVLNEDDQRRLERYSEQGELIAAPKEIFKNRQIIAYPKQFQIEIKLDDSINISPEMLQCLGDIYIDHLLAQMVNEIMQPMNALVFQAATLKSKLKKTPETSEEHKHLSTEFEQLLVEMQNLKAKYGRLIQMRPRWHIHDQANGAVRNTKARSTVKGSKSHAGYLWPRALQLGASENFLDAQCDSISVGGVNALLHCFATLNGLKQL